MIGDLDAALVALDRVRIERRAGALFVECAGHGAEEAQALLARAGVRASVTGEGRGPVRALVPAIVPDLGARPGAVIDRIDIRSVETGEAVAQLLRRRWSLVRPGSERTDAVRRILRGEDRLFAWRRIVWAGPAQLRSGALRGVAPVVFDRDAVTRSTERFAFTAQGLVARWARQ